MPTSSSHPASISRPSCSPRPTPQNCCARSSPNRGYRPSPIALGANTDCYQPIERKYKITRSILEVLAECEHPVTIVTKSALVERDLDLLGPMARKNLVKVFVSIGTLDRELARKLEPRAASPQRRLDCFEKTQ